MTTSTAAILGCSSSAQPSSARGAKPGADQARGGGLPGAGRFARDRAGPPAEVGVVLAGGSLAGKDSSSSSSSFSSASARDLRGGGFRGSFMPMAPRWEHRKGRRLTGPSRPGGGLTHIGPSGRGRETRPRATSWTQGNPQTPAVYGFARDSIFSGAYLPYLQLEKVLKRRAQIKQTVRKLPEFGVRQREERGEGIGAFGPHRPTDAT